MGHFYFARIGTFLLCLDIETIWLEAYGEGHAPFSDGIQHPTIGVCDLEVK
jgi:hypothetical protein